MVEFNNMEGMDLIGADSSVTEITSIEQAAIGLAHGHERG